MAEAEIKTNTYQQFLQSVQIDDRWGVVISVAPKAGFGICKRRQCGVSQRQLKDEKRLFRGIAFDLGEAPLRRFKFGRSKAMKETRLHLQSCICPTPWTPSSSVRIIRLLRWCFRYNEMKKTPRLQRPTFSPINIAITITQAHNSGNLELKCFAPNNASPS